MTEFDTPQKSLETERLRTPSLLEKLGKRVVYFSQTPPHSLWLEKEVAHSPQPLHPSIEQTVTDCREVVSNLVIHAPDNLPFTEKIQLSAQMILFSNQVHSNTFTPIEYKDMESLKNTISATAAQQQDPLTYDQQLAIALTQSEGDIIKALKTLWLASRQYSRWHDGTSIVGLPDFSDEEIMEEMHEWRGALRACKNADNENVPFQDVSGDTYYTWTHVFARVMYGIGPQAYNQVGMHVFEHGTDIMRLTAQKIKKQRVKSDHRVAAAYGNAIGDAILDELDRLASE